MRCGWRRGSTRRCWRWPGRCSSGGLLQLGFQLPYLARLKLLPRPRLNLHDPGVWRVLTLMGPAIFGVSIGQISLLINGIFASFLVTGSVSWLYYADRLMEFPTGVLGVALGTILLPSLSRSFAERTGEEYSRLLDWGLRLTLLLALPAALGLAILAMPLIATLFHHGAFDGHDVAMTSQALIAYSVGLVGLILVKVLAPGFYARQNIKTPVKIGVFTLVATQLMNLAFIYPLRHAGLALAIGLGACLNAWLLYRKLRQHGVYPAAARAGAGSRVQTRRGPGGDGRGAVVRDGKHGELAGRRRPGAGAAPHAGGGCRGGELLRRAVAAGGAAAAISSSAARAVGSQCSDCLSRAAGWLRATARIHARFASRAESRDARSAPTAPVMLVLRHLPTAPASSGGADHRQLRRRAPGAPGDDRARRPGPRASGRWPRA